MNAPLSQIKNILKIVFFWDVTPCSVVDRYQQFERMCSLYIIILLQKTCLWDIQILSKTFGELCEYDSYSNWCSIK
jgi:hypothetical protein